MRSNDHPFFRPLWRRLAIVAVCIVWTVLEYRGGGSLWVWVAFGFTVYAIVNFLVFYRPKEDAPAATDDPESRE
jgi:hypothetical protein